MGSSSGSVARRAVNSNSHCGREIALRSQPQFARVRDRQVALQSPRSRETAALLRRRAGRPMARRGAKSPRPSRQAERLVFHSAFDRRARDVKPAQVFSSPLLLILPDSSRADRGEARACVGSIPGRRRTRTPDAKCPVTRGWTRPRHLQCDRPPPTCHHGWRALPHHALHRHDHHHHHHGARGASARLRRVPVSNLCTGEWALATSLQMRQPSVRYCLRNHLKIVSTPKSDIFNIAVHRHAGTFLAFFAA
ncbi:uncharacterized protein LOC124553542 [Schistocerca americana]|uniref:uncharacterized protein LOC124553542 n=1 Tax=Schistocerca americana TaxID=7009 RepID=UPI001F4F87F9|nr:uncharacterized protein LOC124553542 [Schistocerca americana]